MLVRRLHYSFDLWVYAWRKKWAQGEVVVIRYADDRIVEFQDQADADRFLENLRERLAKFGLELHSDKTCRIEFGRFAEENLRCRGEGKPETFDVLFAAGARSADSRGRAPLHCLNGGFLNRVCFIPFRTLASPLHI